ncbi:MAG: cytochrome P460 family protein [Anaerolineaceae bacterium]|nr:cytochrome P460 family protein [Anaerolineaceae bacterium]
MMKKYLPLIYAGLVIGLLMLAAATQQPKPAPASVPNFGMTLPDNYRDEFSLYLVVDRPDRTVRFVYAAPDVVEAVQAGEEIPYGARLIIETYDAQTDLVGNVLRDSTGHLIAGTMQPNIHMIEKRDDWTVQQLPTPIGVIDWNFGSFDAQSYLPSTENRNDCLTCHDNGAFRRDFVFSRPLLEDFVSEGEVQYLYCRFPGRGNCI